MGRAGRVGVEEGMVGMGVEGHEPRTLTLGLYKWVLAGWVSLSLELVV